METESSAALRRRIAELEAENQKLKKEVQDSKESLSFLSEEQISNARKNPNAVTQWSDASIIKGLKLRFQLGKTGYNYLRSTKYPSPSYSTLNRRMQGIKVDFGVINSLMTLLQTKVEAMDENDRMCCISIDEMEISGTKDFDNVGKKFVGNVTLGPKGVTGNHYTGVLLRGLKTPWKQIVAHEITGPSTNGSDMKKLTLSTIQAAKAVGLKVKAIVSDMGSNNKAMWNAVGVNVTRSDRNTSFSADTETIHVLADPPHLLKNIRSAFLSHVLTLPEDICKAHDLPSRNVSSSFLKDLWEIEKKSKDGLRSLHHLHKEHLFPSHFSKMNVATAVQLFSLKTAAALEKAVRLKQVHKDALTTAWWIRVMNEWFDLMSARHRKKSITLRNKERKLEFLESVVDIFQNMTFGKGWKPVQTGVILSTISVMNLAKELLSLGYEFLMPGRLSQDALENVFSQIRKKAGMKPSALQVRRVIKMICVSQFVSDVQNTNYASDSDLYLLDYSRLNKCTKSGDGGQNDPITSGNEEDNDTDDIEAETVTGDLSLPAENDIYYIAGATVNAILKRKICESCVVATNCVRDPEMPQINDNVTYLTKYSDLGGLKKPSSGIYRLCKEAEIILQDCKESLLEGELCLNEHFVEKVLLRCPNVILPPCCSVKQKIVSYYLSVRCRGIAKHLSEIKEHSESFGSASVYKKQKMT